MMHSFEWMELAEFAAQRSQLHGQLQAAEATGRSVLTEQLEAELEALEQRREQVVEKLFGDMVGEAAA